MPRPYTMSEKAKAARVENAANARKHLYSLDNYVRKIVARAPELTPEQLEKLRTLLAPVPGGKAE